MVYAKRGPARIPVVKTAEQLFVGYIDRYHRFRLKCFVFLYKIPELFRDLVRTDDKHSFIKSAERIRQRIG